MPESHSHHNSNPPDIRVCFLPNCAFVVQPTCPTCLQRQITPTQVPITSSTLVNSTGPAPENDGSSEALEYVTIYNTNGVAQRSISQSTPIITKQWPKSNEPIALRPEPSLFESDVGLAAILCYACQRPFQVFVNATVSVVGMVPPGSIPGTDTPSHGR
ncbi:hypothetical protein BDW22DRAFT_1481248 [Trametopsis cervina]|nr:hypothetical protein BDW22DRAFT_1481248 [Trametopsis cervina]